ncbi:MAG: sulfur oxidation c-type cytochrome SoxX, partial [Microbacteriaceae bacterium]|nr:sulfur oxidation c-type cytochrome SoxX [Burkholderiaceae bacterium]
MQTKHALLAAAAATLLIAGCASLPSADELDRQALAMIKGSFREQGIAKLDRLDQDLGQQACSSDQPPPEAVAQRVEAEAWGTIPWASGGRDIRDRRGGGKVAQER